MKIGYARVSTADQNLDRQIDNLRAAGAEQIYSEKITGTKADRPEFQNMMKALRPGDTLIIDSFSRLSRSTKDLLDTVEKLQEGQVNLVSLKESLDSSTPQGKLMLTMLAALSQFERDIIAERTVDGLKAARARGRMGGRPKASDKKTAQALKLYDAQTLTIREISEVTGLSTATINRRVRERRHAEHQKMGQNRHRGQNA